MDVNDLPPKARAKLTLLNDAASESQVLLASFLRRISELRNSANNVFNQAKNAEAGREIARLSGKQVAQQVRHREATQLLAQLDHWLRNLPRGTVLEDARHAKPKYKGSALEAIERIRSEIKKLRSDISAVQRAVPTPEELKAAARDYVKANADRARPHISASQHGSFNLTFGTLDFSSAKLDPFAYLCWLNPTAVVAALEKDISGMPPAPLALSAADKAVKLTELSEAMLSLERDEEALIAGSTQEIARRPQADPRAVLGVVKKAKMPAATEVAEAVA
jgi:hypothetical protein